MTCGLPTGMQMDVVLALTLVLSAAKDLLYVFDSSNDYKQILRRCAPQNDSSCEKLEVI